MAHISDTLGVLRQNLIDGGCDENTISKCIVFAEKGEWEKIASVLSEQRSKLLKNVHSRQKQIDCLDFLAYRINKEHNKEL